MIPGEDMTTILCFCVAEGSNERGWKAICLNLDVAAEGRTLADVQWRLDAAVRSYIEEVMKLPERDRRRLLHRSVPLKVKLAYAFRLFWHSIRNTRQNGNEQASFEIPCHA